MGTYSKEIPDERLKRSQYDEVKIQYIIGSAKSATQVTLQNAPAILMFDTGDSSQAAVDALLGDAADITYATSFSSTSLGTDAIGFVVAHGSAKKAISAFVKSCQTAGGSPTNFQVLFNGEGAVTTALASALSNKFAVTPAGHLYGKCVLTNIDSCTAGSIEIVLRFEAA